MSSCKVLFKKWIALKNTALWAALVFVLEPCSLCEPWPRALHSGVYFNNVYHP